MLFDFLKISLCIMVFSLVVINLGGCSTGGGGGSNVVSPTTIDPIHTSIQTNPAYVYQAGVSYNVSVTFSETRGDPIQFNRMLTYRTYADPYNSGRTPNYYNAGPSIVYGYMFDIQGTMSNNIRDAYIHNSSSIAAWTPNALQAFERRTLSTTVMIGKAFQVKPAGFNGIFIPWVDYQQWSQQGIPGIRFWVTLEGYDYKLNDSYNIHVPLEIMFPVNLSSDGSNPYTTGTNTGIGTDSNTDPYDPLGNRLEKIQ